MKSTIPLLLITLSIPTLRAGDLDHKMEAYAFGADMLVTNHGDHATYGGNLGFGIDRRTTVFGEVSHAHFGGGGNLIDFNGGVKYTLLSSSRFEPYVLGAMGGVRSDVFSSRYHFGVHAGGGARMYVGKCWGIQPEVRWTRYSNYLPGANIVRFSGGLFLQWGR